MKILPTQSNRGSALITALILSTVLGVVIASYLTLLGSRNLITYRSQAWNSAIPVLEAGVEEAFTHLYDDTNSPTANGWSSLVVNGSTIYQKRCFTQTNGAYCMVTLSNITTTQPVIYSRGFVPAPLGTGYISRLVRIIATNPIVFSKAIAAQGPITLSGGATVDSFNSGNTNYSTNGRYDPAKREAHGGVATDSRSSTAISISSAHIYGQTDTGPGGAVNVSGNGGVGDLGWGSGIEPGYTNGDMNITYPDQTQPSGYAGWPAPASGNYSVNGTNNYTYRLASGGYTVPGDFAMSGGQNMVVTGNAILYVAGKIDISGQAFIYLAPGSSLQIYVAGSSANLSGGGVINGSGVAADFSYYGLPGNTSVNYSGGSDFVGTINAPEADFQISGGSALIGAVIAKSFTSSGGSSVHFDESLAPVGPLVMTSYREL